MTVGSTVCGLFDKSTLVFLWFTLLCIFIWSLTCIPITLSTYVTSFVGYDVTTKLIVIV